MRTTLRLGVERARLAACELGVDRFPGMEFTIARFDRSEGGFDGFDGARFHSRTAR